jgi:mxaL protein
MFSVCVALGFAAWLPAVPLERQVLDAIVVVDITQSMNAEDEFQGGEPVSRLAAVKQALARAVPELPCGSKLGLGIFTEYRTLLLFTPVETCVHRAELLEAIEHLNGQMAWARSSEIAKGFYSGLRIAKHVANSPALAFVTDGHEAPPVNPHHRPEFDGQPGAVAGVIVGVGGSKPVPIPKVDPDGRPLGFWAANDVLQADRFTLGRQGSLEHEAMADSAADSPVPAALRASPGSEQLSYLHESYLELLAGEARFGYRRLDANDLTAVLTNPPMTRKRTTPSDLRWIPGGLALLALVAQYAFAGRRRPLREKAVPSGSRNRP